MLFLQALDSDQMNAVVNAMFERQVRKGEYVILQGEDGDNFYVIERSVNYNFRVIVLSPADF